MTTCSSSTIAVFNSLKLRQTCPTVTFLRINLTSISNCSRQKFITYLGHSSQTPRKKYFVELVQIHNEVDRTNKDTFSPTNLYVSYASWGWCYERINPQWIYLLTHTISNTQATFPRLSFELVNFWTRKRVPNGHERCSCCRACSCK